ncbi:hypothetical protein GCM10023340_04700 [Nocardioides marinquilinus]|uniref:Histidine kinase/HSP90-like ATPase domain-containing protein n=1 Tax=Nocardioides marinquilinus TaxID=1210400 RepID=A0ABP9P7W2_9ACTN
MSTAYDGRLALDVDLGAPATARAELEEPLRRHGCGDVQIRDALMVVSELVMNALVHGEGDDRGQVHLAWQVDPDCVVTVMVTDSGGSSVPHLEEPGAREGGGRGLRLVEALSDSWAVDTDGGRTTVTAVITPRDSQAG